MFLQYLPTFIYKIKNSQDLSTTSGLYCTSSQASIDFSIKKKKTCVILKQRDTSEKHAVKSLHLQSIDIVLAFLPYLVFFPKLPRF